MSATVPPTIPLRGFFTSQRWLLGKTLSEIELLIGYRPGRLSTLGAAVYGFPRVPNNWEFELGGYTNVSGGMAMDPAWVAADRSSAAYYAKTGTRSSETVLKDNARSCMTIAGPDRLIKVKPLLEDPFDTYPPGRGIPQWRISETAENRRTLHGKFLLMVKPGQRYPV
jgi:hypothetical protein